MISYSPGVAHVVNIWVAQGVSESPKSSRDPPHSGRSVPKHFGLFFSSSGYRLIKVSQRTTTFPEWWGKASGRVIESKSMSGMVGKACANLLGVVYPGTVNASSYAVFIQGCGFRRVSQSSRDPSYSGRFLNTSSL